MLMELPEPVQKQVIYYLETDNFPAAKRLHDLWLYRPSEIDSDSDESGNE
jgi:hypothetical protein